MYYRLRKQMCVCEREMINAREISVLLFKKTNVCERDDKCKRNKCVII